MTISAEEVRRIAGLARLDLTDDEVEQFRDELSRILDYVAQLERLEAGHAAEPPRPDQPLREDIIEGCEDAEALRAEAPELDEGYIRVPRVIG